MANNTEMDEMFLRLLEVTDILDEINHRLPLFAENFAKIEMIKAKAANRKEEDLTIIKLELERIRSVYIQEIKERRQEFMQKIFSEMKPELNNLTPEEIRITIEFFESKPGRNFKDRIIPLSEKMDKAINEIGRDVIKRA
ncbi:MAG: hypothetical protein KAI71_05510 [Candidatus Pacebacteria bacterium]|nr:hypothetical protein [Candidatus Paceibacterota bacterium]